MAAALILHARIAKRSRQDVSQHGPALPRQQSGASVSSSGLSSAYLPEEQRSSGFFCMNSACPEALVSRGSALPLQQEFWQLLVSSIGAAIGAATGSGAEADGPQQSYFIVKMIICFQSNL
jgi:hypothetical protein